MSCKNYNQIMGFLSSSELNRCKKNGLFIWEGRENWIDVLKYPWLTRKLRRKIGHLLQLDLLPVVYKPIDGLCDMDYSIFDLPQFKELGQNMLEQYLKAEDEFILKGLK